METEKIKFWLALPNVDNEIETKFRQYMEYAIMNLRNNPELTLNDDPIIKKALELHNGGYNTQLVNVAYELIAHESNRVFDEGASYDNARTRKNNTVPPIIEDDNSYKLDKTGSVNAYIIMFATIALGIFLGILIQYLVK